MNILLKWRWLIKKVIRAVAGYMAKTAHEQLDTEVWVLVVDSDVKGPIPLLQEIVVGYDVDWAKMWLDIVTYANGKYGSKWTTQPLLESAEEGVDWVDKDYDYGKVFVKAFREALRAEAKK